MALLYDFECAACGHVFEELVDRNNPDPVKCVACGQFQTSRLITGTHLDYRMGTDLSMPTMADKWARMHREAAKQRDN